MDQSYMQCRKASFANENKKIKKLFEQNEQILKLLQQKYTNLEKNVGNNVADNIVADNIVADNIDKSDDKKNLYMVQQPFYYTIDHSPTTIMTPISVVYPPSPSTIMYDILNYPLVELFEQDKQTFNLVISIIFIAIGLLCLL